MDVTLFGAQAGDLRPLIEAHANLRLVEDDPEVVVCFGGDGTLLAAELRWPNVPKVPLRNSRRGFRCVAGPPEEVIEQLAEDRLARTEHLKIECAVHHAETEHVERSLLAINEFTVHKGRSNASVRFQVWFDDQRYGDGGDHEIIGDGLMVSTPFGSTAYFNQITRGVFWSGIGVAFMYTPDHTNHLIVPEDTVIRVRITRGPAVLAHDNSSEYIDLTESDELTVRKAEKPAILLAPEQG